MTGDDGRTTADADAGGRPDAAEEPGTEAAGNPAPVLSASLLLRPSTTANAFEETVHRLVQSLRLGLVEPGDRLPAERELASMLQVSRDTVRDAIAALTGSGYLVARRGRYGGTFVVDPLPAPSGAGGPSPLGPEPTAEALADTLALRSVLEVGTARRLATADLTAEDRDRLYRACEDCARSAPEGYRIADAHLHLLMGELVGAPSLLPALADVRLRVNGYLDRIPLLGPNLDHSTEQHERIVDAVLRGRPDEAAAAMAEHLEGTEKLLRGFLG